MVGESNDNDILLGVISAFIPACIAALYWLVCEGKIVFEHKVELNMLWLFSIFLLAIFDFILKLNIAEVGSISLNMMVFAVVGKIVVVVEQVQSKEINSVTFVAWLIALALTIFSIVVYGKLRDKFSKGVRGKISGHILNNLRGDDDCVDFYSKGLPFSIWHFATKNEKQFFESKMKCSVDISKNYKIFVAGLLSILSTVVLLLAGIK